MTEAWLKANQRYLMASLGLVRRALQRHHSPPGPGGGHRPAEDQARREWEAARAALPFPSALDRLVAAFRLTEFERDTLLLAAGVELEGTFASLCGACQGSPSRPHPTFGLALAILPGAHWSALAPGAPLRHWHLLELGSGDGLTTRPLIIDEWALHYLTGTPILDERLAVLLQPVSRDGDLAPSHQAVVRRLVQAWKQAHGGAELPVVQLCGEDAADRHQVAAQAAEDLGVALYRLSLGLLPAHPADLDLWMRLWQRQTLLTPAVLLLDMPAATADEPHRERARLLLERLGGALILSGRDPWSLGERPGLSLPVGKPTLGEQRQVWLHGLGGDTHRNGQVEALISHFDLSAATIRAVCRQAGGGAEPAGGAPEPDRLWEDCRAAARSRLEDLAQRLEPAATWDDLVLPEAQLRTLREIVIHVKHRSTVYDTWGFAAQSHRGLGISALFTGSSGTGKTMAAEVLAHELKLDLYRIDLSQVVSKYIGETEKNLRRVFDAAEAGGSVLLFDEADALFGKRSEVKDSHDRYANIEVSYLLTRMESYRGLAILTTNLKGHLDQAFLRRIRFTVHFPFPDAALRAQIWRNIFPTATPREGLEATKLAQLNLPGGNIRNIALHAAFLAADRHEPVRMGHLLQAARHEYAKLEKPLSPAEISGWE